MPFEVAPQEQAPTPEKATTQSEVYVEGEPLPAGVLASPKRAQEPAAAAEKRETAPPAPIPEDPVQKAIERKLEAGVGEAFESLDPLAREVFRVRGEETGVAVRTLLAAPTLDTKTIEKLSHAVNTWLALLPAASPAWLEQETRAKVTNLLDVRGS